MENKRAFFLIEQSNLDPKDKQFLAAHIQVYEDMFITLENELSMRKMQLASIKNDLDDFNKNKNRLIGEINKALSQLATTNTILEELNKVNEELSTIKADLAAADIKSLSKSKEQIYYLEYKLRKAVQSINMIDFAAIRHTI